MAEPTCGAAGTAGSGPGSPRIRSRGPARPGIAGRIAAQARRLVRDARGATAIEYAMIGGLIFAVVAGSIRVYGSKVDAVYGRIGSAISQVN